MRQIKVGDESETTTTGSSLIQIGFAQVGSESDWRMAQTQSIKKAFSEENGYQLDFIDCNNEQERQIQALQDFIDKGVDCIVLDPILEEGYDSILKEAQDAEIPVIVIDRNIKADESLYSCWVGSNFEQEGIDAAKWLEVYLKDEQRESEEINIVTIQGTIGTTAQIGRTQGFNSTMQSNWNMLDEQCGEFTEEGGRAIMSAFIKKYPDIDVVVCQNDNEAYGAIEAIKENGLTCGPEGDMVVISFDATQGGFKRMIAGELNVDIECNPLQGELVAQIAQKLVNGETVEKVQYMEEGVFSADKAATLIETRVY